MPNTSDFQLADRFGLETLQEGILCKGSDVFMYGVTVNQVRLYSLAIYIASIITLIRKHCEGSHSYHCTFI